ncbi:MAG TPA: hypothetical protein VGW78_02235 [Candidatus Babeliales bacterium]|jgi:hypothetical protein|nr:hypothetical protein [Candidatus Babeliales bacterium]
MKQAIRAYRLYILFTVSINLYAQDKRPLIFKQIDLWSRIKRRFFPIKRPSIPFFGANFAIDLEAFNSNSFFPNGWRFADKEIQNYVATLTKDPSIVVIETNGMDPTSLKSPYTNNKYIILNSAIIQILKNKSHNNILLSWKEFKTINEYDKSSDLLFTKETPSLHNLIHQIIRGKFYNTLHPWEIDTIILHEYAHLQHDDTAKIRKLNNKYKKSEITAEEYYRQRQKLEKEADTEVLKSNDIHILMGVESSMLKSHLNKKIHNIKDPHHPYPLLRAWQAQDKIKEKLGPYGEE